MPRSRMFGIYALVGIVALGAGLLVARVFGSSPNMPAGYVTPTAVTGQIEAAAIATPASSATAAVATAAPSAVAEATTTPASIPSPVTPTAPSIPTSPSTAPPTSTSAASYVEYTVQKGDILKAIAQKYGVTVEEILAINRIPNPDSLIVASVIRIPKK
jgi:LysM repeat protein